MEIFGGNTPAAVQYLLAFVIILIVLAAFAAVLRRISGERSRAGFSGSSARHRQQRLGIVDAVDIDSHRQLLLLRRDNVEHLVMIGGPNDLLVESGIGRLPYRAPGPLPPQQHHAPVSEEGNAPDLGAPGLATGAAFARGPLNAPTPEQMARARAMVEGEAARAPVRMETPQPNVDVSIIADPSTERSPGLPRPLATPLARSAPLMSGARSATPPVKSPDLPIAPQLGLASETGSPKDYIGREVAGKAFGVQGQGPAATPSQSTSPQGVGSATTREQDNTQRPLGGMTRQLENALRRPFGAVRPSSMTGINLGDVPAAKEAGAGAGTQADVSATKEVEAPEPVKKDPVPSNAGRPAVAPYVAPSPFSPVFSTRSAPAAPSEPERPASIPFMGTLSAAFPSPTAPATHPVQESSINTLKGVASKDTSKDLAEGKGSQAATAEVSPAPLEKASAPAAPKPEAAKPLAFDLTSLENIEAEFARLLGRTPPSKDD